MWEERWAFQTPSSNFYTDRSVIVNLMGFVGLVSTLLLILLCTIWLFFLCICNCANYFYRSKLGLFYFYPRNLTRHYFYSPYTATESICVIRIRLLFAYSMPAQPNAHLHSKRDTTAKLWVWGSDNLSLFNLKLYLMFLRNTQCDIWRKKIIETDQQLYVSYYNPLKQMWQNVHP